MRRLMSRSTLLLVVVTATCAVSAQPRKSNKAPISNSTSASASYSRYLEALKARDFKTIIDLTFTYQQEVAQIKAANPRALWPQRIEDYYTQKTTSLTEASSFWSDFGRQTMAMMGDPAQGLRAVFYYLPPSAKWKVSEIRKGAVQTPTFGQYVQTTVYITVEYPLDRTTPVINKSFLREAMLNVSVHSGSQLIMGISKVNGTEHFWSKPYPESAKSFLEEKFREDILKGDSDAANELIELVGWGKTEPYLLEVLGSLSEPRSKGFNLAAALLSQKHVQKAAPMILSALGDRSPEVEGNYAHPDRNLVNALEGIGKSDVTPQASELLKKRLRRLISGYNPEYEEDTKEHLRALASVEADSRWLSFPFLYRRKLDNGMVATNGWLFGSLVDELSDKRTESSIIDDKSPSLDSNLNFLRSNLKPCQGVFCPSNLGVEGLTVIDAVTLEISGPIEESPRIMQRRQTIGKYKMVLTRKPDQPDSWRLYNIYRVGDGGEKLGDGRSDVSPSASSSAPPSLDELVALSKKLIDAGLNGDKALIDSYLADNYVWRDVGNRKTMDRAKFLSRVKRDKSIRNYSCGDYKISTQGAVTSLTYVCEYDISSLILANHVRQSFTDRYIWANGSLKLISEDTIVLPNR